MGGMPKPSQKAIIERRREAVAQLALRELTVREIVIQLPQIGVVRPDGKPYSRGQIHTDLKELRSEWHEKAMAHIEERIAAQRAKLDQIERQGWIDKNMDTVLKALKQKADLDGMNSPTRTEISGPKGGPIQHQVEDLSQLSTNELKTYRELRAKVSESLKAHARN